MALSIDSVNVENSLFGTAVGFDKSVRVATTTAGTLATSFENGDIVDGITLLTGDRILIKNQASGIENGIYTVNATGAPTRTEDFDIGSSANGIFASVVVGTTNNKTQWICTNTSGSDIIGTNALIFEELTTNNAQLLTFSATGPASDIDISAGTTPITWNVELIKDNIYTHTASSSDITINATGRYEIDINIMGYVPSATGQYLAISIIYVDSGSGFVGVPGSIGASYHIGGGGGLILLRSLAVAVVNQTINITSGSIVRIQSTILYASSVGSSVFIIGGQSRIEIKKV